MDDHVRRNFDALIYSLCTHYDSDKRGELVKLRQAYRDLAESAYR